MELYATDQICISSVRSDVMKPGEKFTVSKAHGEELLKKLPLAVSKKPPKAKPQPISIKSAIAEVNSQVARAEQEAEDKKRLILESVTSAQSQADTRIAEIGAAVVLAQTDADAKLAEIKATLDAARGAADRELQEIEARLDDARRENESGSGDGGGQEEKQQPAPENKAATPPKNK